MSIVINDINALDPENQLLTIENNIIVKRVTLTLNELFNLLKDFSNHNALKKSEMKKSNFLKDVEWAKRLAEIVLSDYNKEEQIPNEQDLYMNPININDIKTDNIIVKRVTSINDLLSRYVKFRDFGLAAYDKYFIAYKIDDKIKFLTFYSPELNNDNLTN